MPSQRVASLAPPLPPGVAAPMARLIPPDLPPPTPFP